jgi:hypothetical protein
MKIVTAVQLHPKKGYVQRARVREIDPGTGVISGAEQEIEAHAVFDRLDSGERIASLLPVTDQPHLGVPGPLLRKLVIQDTGHETFELDDDARTVKDLRQF